MPKNATPQDVPEPTSNYKPPAPGSAIRVDGKRVKTSGEPVRTPPPARNFKPLFDRIKAEAEAAESEVDDRASRANAMGDTYKKGGKVSASKRADGIAQRGKTRGTMVMCGGGMARK